MKYKNLVHVNFCLKKYTSENFILFLFYSRYKIIIKKEKN